MSVQYSEYSGITEKSERYFVDAPEMAAAFEFGGQEGIDDGKRQLHARDPGPQAQHVGIVVQAGEAGMQFRGAQRRADALVTVGRYGHADPRTADQDAGHIFGKNAAQFQRMVLACPRKTLEQALRQLETALRS